jgi:hydroxymethylpyrimidine/phosphomethylpyrimidine kinase / thiaminase
VDFGISKEEIEGTRESSACQAYARYILDVGAAGDLLTLYTALAPCLLGYHAVAQRLFHDPKSVKEGNKYWKWVENYVEGDYTEAVGRGRAVLEEEARRCGAAFARGKGGKLDELVEVFREATRLEIGFWEEGAHLPEEEP